jgi:hypothetical protein
MIPQIEVTMPKTRPAVERQFADFGGREDNRDGVAPFPSHPGPLAS